jgi:hypothetical protein
VILRGTEGAGAVRDGSEGVRGQACKLQPVALVLRA